MDEPLPSARFAASSFCLGLAWWMIAGVLYGWHFLASVGSTKLGTEVSLLLVVAWWVTGPLAIAFWLLSVVSGETSCRGWYLAWVGLVMGLSGPVHLAVVKLL